MNKRRKTKAEAVSRIAPMWRRVVKLFRQYHKKCQSGSDLLIASLAFNEPRIYLSPDLTHHCV